MRENPKRLQKLKRELKKEDRFPYLITDLVNIRYLTGFTGSFAYLIVGDKKSFFISDSRYAEYVSTILPAGFEFVMLQKDLFNTMKVLLKEKNLRRLHLEEHALPISTFLQLKSRLTGVKLLPGGDLVNRIRMIKDPDEIALLAEAAAITDRCFEHLLGFIRPGVREWEISVEIELFYRKNGCRKSSFTSIVASGAGSSMPHYETSLERRVGPGDPVLIDMGCEYRGYNSDLTRTVFVTSIDPVFRDIYAIVKDAQESALRAVKPGITTGKLDAVARDIITNAGYGTNFGHSLGHGLGMEVHELPAIREGETRLHKNMAITVEPGIYLPGKGGVRIEDMVLVTAGGADVLTKSPKEIIVL